MPRHANRLGKASDARCSAPTSRASTRTMRLPWRKCASWTAKVARSSIWTVCSSAAGRGSGREASDFPNCYPAAHQSQPSPYALASTALGLAEAAGSGALNFHEVVKPVSLHWAGESPHPYAQKSPRRQPARGVEGFYFGSPLSSPPSVWSTGFGFIP
jgi:hypothetical protein